jgi:hypothetical protein
MPTLSPCHAQTLHYKRDSLVVNYKPQRVESVSQCLDVSFSLAMLEMFVRNIHNEKLHSLVNLSVKKKYQQNLQTVSVVNR